jgi:hypothetical protein
MLEILSQTNTLAYYAHSSAKKKMKHCEYGRLLQEKEFYEIDAML